MSKTASLMQNRKFVPYVVWLMRLVVNAVGYPQKVSDFLSSIRCK